MLAFSPEFRLLVRCARLPSDLTAAPPVVAVREAATEVRDWGEFLDLAHRHWLAPLVYRCLEESAAEITPAAVRTALRNAYLLNAARAEIAVRELHRILQLAADHGLRVVPFKGPALAAALYGHPVCRGIGDLGFFADPETAWRLRSLLLGNGYVSASEATPAQEKALKRAGWEHGFFHRRHGLYVDINSSLAQQYFDLGLLERDFDDLLSWVVVEGQRIRTFAPAPLLLVICAHGSKHGWNRLDWLADVLHLVHRYPELDFERVFRVARRRGLERVLLLGLGLLREVFDVAPSPPAAEAIARDRPLTPLLQRCLANLRTGSGSDDVLWRARIQERLRDRVRYLGRIAVTPSHNDFRWVSLPERFFFVYYLLRPLRLVLYAARIRAYLRGQGTVRQATARPAEISGLFAPGSDPGSDSAAAAGSDCDTDADADAGEKGG